VRNESEARWPSTGDAAQRFRIYVGNHWLDPSGRVLVNDDARASLPFDLAPGEELEVPLVVNAPRAAGAYVLELDLVQESVSWFGLRGSPTLRRELSVEP
jgi:hypothetical protein